MAVIFDCDDTLLASAQTRWQALIETARLFDIDLNEGVIRASWGKPFNLLIADLVPGIDVERFIHRYRGVMKLFPPAPTAGAVSLLSDLYQQGISIDIVTSSRRELILQDLEALNMAHFIAEIWGCEQTAPYAKPDPNVLVPVLNALLAKGLTKDQVVYIGDSVRDYAVALGNRVHFFAVTTGLEDASAFLAAGLAASYIFSSLLDFSLLITTE